MLLPDAHGFGRVSPDETGRENGVHAGRDRLRGAVLAALAPAHEPRIRLDPDEIAVPLGERGLRRIEPLRAERRAQDVRTDGFDFHRSLSPECASRASNRSAILR